MRYAFSFLSIFLFLNVFAGDPIIKSYPAYQSTSDLQSVILNAEIISNGGSPLIRTGFVWSRERHPNLESNEGVTDANVTTNINATVGGIEYGDYFFKPFAINYTDTAYGNEMVFRITNAYAGNYTSNGYFYHPSAPRSIFNRYKYVAPLSSTSVFFEYGDFGFGYNVIFDIDPITNNVTPRSDGSLSVIDFGAELPTSNPLYTPQWASSFECNNVYDPVSKSFKVRYGYLGGTGYRVIEEIVTLNTSAVGQPLPAVVHSADPKTITSGSIITVKGLNLKNIINPYSYVFFRKNGVDAFIDSLIILSDTIAKIMVGGKNEGTLYYAGDAIESFTYVSPNPVSTTGWDYFGGPGFLRYQPKIAFDQGNIPHIVYLDSATNRLIAKKYQSGSWTSLGSYISPAKASNYNIIINTSNIPIVSYSDSTNGGRITVKGFYGGSWLALGSPGFTATRTNYEQYLQYDSSNNLYVLGKNNTTNTFSSPTLNTFIPDNTANGISNTIQVSQIPVGVKILSVSARVNINHTYSSDLVINLKAPNGKILSLSKFLGGSGFNYVYPTIGFVGTSFSSTGGTLDNGSETLSGNFRPDALNTPLDAAVFPIQNPSGFISDATDFSDLQSVVNGNWTLAVADGKGAWDPYGNGFLTIDTGRLLNWSLDIQYIINNTDTVSRNYLYKYSGDSWVNAHPALLFNNGDDANGYLSNDASYDISIVKSNGNLLVAYPNSNHDTLFVKKYNGTSWFNYPAILPSGNLGNNGTYGIYGIYYPSIVLDNEGNPIVSYQDDDAYERLSVKKYKNGQWQYLGSPKFSKSRTYQHQLLVDKLGVPYVYFYDGLVDRYGTIMRYNKVSNVWENFGEKGFIPNSIAPRTYFNESMTLDTSGLPYVSFIDTRNNNRGSIFKRLIPSTTIQGTFLTPNGDSIPNVSVKFTGGGSTMDVVSTNKGKYSVTGFAGGAYQLIPSKNNDVNKTNGVSTLDILKIQSHILRIDSLNSPYKIIAADVNNSGSVTALDILYIRKLILGTLTSFPGDKLWGFVDASQTFADANNPFPINGVKSYTSLSTLSNQNFRGVKLGDVTYDWNPSILRTTNHKDISLYADTVMYRDGDTVRVLFKAKSFTKVMGMQFTLGWDASDLHFIEVGSNPMNIQFGKQRTDDGLLSLQWNDHQNRSVSLSEGTMLFELKFLKSDPQKENKIHIGSIITQNEGYDEALNFHEVKLEGAVIRSANQNTVTDINISKVKIFPNPTSGNISLNIPVDVATEAKLSLYQTSGKKIQTISISLNKGMNTIHADLHKLFGRLESGVYFLNVQYKTVQENIRIIVTK